MLTQNALKKKTKVHSAVVENIRVCGSSAAVPFACGGVPSKNTSLQNAYNIN